MNPSRQASSLGQVGVSTLAVLSLLIAALLNPELWLQFSIVVTLVLLTTLFIFRVNRLVGEPVESEELQQVISAAENQKSKKEILAGKVAQYWPAFALVMALVGVGLSIGNQFDLSSALIVFSTILLLSYGQVIAMAVPVAVSRALRVAAESGILIRNRSAFERAAKLSLVLFTKGGVLTTAPTGVNGIRLAANSTIKDEHKLLAIAASVESPSSHVFAKAITNSAKKLKLKVTKPNNFIEIPGYGVQGVVGGSQVLIGSTALLIQRNIRMEVQELIYADESTNSGYSVVCVVVDGHLEGLFTFSDLLKATSAQAVYTVALERIRVGLITGDSAGTAQNKATELNVSEVYAELSPERKAAFVAVEKDKGSTVGIIADPTTNAALLATADLSIALIGESGELAESADVLVRGVDPELAAQVVALSSRMRRKINLGLGIALGYGVLSLLSFVAIVSPLQVGALPAVAALLGSLSVLLVSTNAYSVGKLK
jgi:Cu2+-exporting ATPase